MLGRGAIWAMIGAFLCLVQMSFVTFAFSIVIAGTDVTRLIYCLGGAAFGGAAGFSIGLLSAWLDRRANAARATKDAKAE